MATIRTTIIIDRKNVENSHLQKTKKLILQRPKPTTHGGRILLTYLEEKKQLHSFHLISTKIKLNFP